MYAEDEDRNIRKSGTDPNKGRNGRRPRCGVLEMRCKGKKASIPIPRRGNGSNVPEPPSHHSGFSGSGRGRCSRWDRRLSICSVAQSWRSSRHPVSAKHKGGDVSLRKRRYGGGLMPCISSDQCQRGRSYRDIYPSSFRLQPAEMLSYR